MPSIPLHPDFSIENNGYVCISDGHTSSLMTSESDSDDEELLFDDNLNRRPRSSPLSLVPKTVSNGTAKKNGYSKLFKEANA